jgi:hypothetical protein
MIRRIAQILTPARNHAQTLDEPAWAGRGDP